MSEVVHTQDDTNFVRYDVNGEHDVNGANHIYQNGQHIGADEYLRQQGYEPTPSAYARQAVEATQENTATPITVVQEPTEPVPIDVNNGNQAAAPEQDPVNTDLADRLAEIQAASESAFQALGERLNQLEQQIRDRDGEAPTGINPAPAPVEAEPAAVDPPAETDPGSQLGNMVGNPGQAEVRGQTADGEPYIYRRRPDGQWEVSRNGNLAREWFAATPQDIMRDLGIEMPAAPPAPAEAPAQLGAPIVEAPAVPVAEVPAPEEPAVVVEAPVAEPIPATTEQPVVIAPEAPAEAPAPAVAETVPTAEEEALAAALAALGNAGTEYDDVRQRLQQDLEARQQERANAGEQVDGDAVVVETPATRQERRGRLRRNGRRAVGVLLGGVAGYFIGRHFGEHTTELVVQSHGHNAGKAAAKGAEHAGKFKTENLGYYGDTIWAHGRATLAQAMGGKMPRDWQVYQWCKETMSLPGNKERILNSQGHWRSIWEGARHLPVGFNIRENQNITNALARR